MERNLEEPERGQHHAAEIVGRAESRGSAAERRNRIVPFTLLTAEGCETAVAETERAFGVQVPIVNATKETLVEKLRPLVESADLRRELGERGREYVERVHDMDRIGQQPVDIYESL